ncbi:MAG: preprotein translocase subunit SecG [Gammaproteobacteria bacterium]
MLSNFLLVLHLLVAVTIVILVLLQQGKGADMGAAFGGGSSQSLFGARGSANFLSRMTSVLVTVFFLSSMTLAYLYTRQSETSSISRSSVVAPPPLSDFPSDVPPVTPQDGAGAGDDVPAVPE